MVGVHVTCAEMKSDELGLPAGQPRFQDGGLERPTVHPFVGMHGAVPEVLPTIAEEDGHPEASRRLENNVGEFCGPHFPCSKAVWRCLQQLVDDH